MRLVATKPDVLEGYKQQAERLREYLKSAGIELKHTNALEAVAKMHGHKNYHLLQNHAASQDAPWLISTYTSGLMAMTHLANSLPDGIGVFCHQLARVSTRPNLEITLRVKEHGPYRGLYAENYGALLVSLMQPNVPVVEQVGLDGLDELNLSELGRAIGDAVWLTDGYDRSKNGWVEFTEKVERERFHDMVNSMLEIEALEGAVEMPKLFCEQSLIEKARNYLLNVSFRSKGVVK